MYQYMFKIKNKIKFTIARKRYCLDEIFWYHSIALENFENDGINFINKRNLDFKIFWKKRRRVDLFCFLIAFDKNVLD